MMDIKDRINNLTELDSVTMENIINDIETMTDEEKKELYDFFIKRAKEILISSSMESSDKKAKISEVVNNVTKSSLDEETIDNIIIENNFGETEILNENNESETNVEEKKEEREIAKINARIAEIEAELGKKNIEEEEIDEEIKRLETEKANKIKEINSELGSIKGTNSETVNVDTLQEWVTAKEELEKIVRKPGRMATDEETKALQLFYTATSRPSGENNIENALAAAKSLSNGSEIKEALIKSINKLKNHYAPKTKTKESETKNDTLQEWVTAKAELEKIVRSPGRFASDKETKALQLFYIATSRPSGENNIENALAAAKSLSDGSEIKEALINAINKLENHYNPKQQETQKVENIKVDTLQEWVSAKAELEKISRRPGRMATDEERKALQLFYTASSRPTANNNIENALAAAQNLPNGSEIKEALIKAINKLENHYAPKTPANLTEKIKEIQSEYDKKVENLQKLKRLKAIRDAYNKIIEDAIQNFENEKKFSKEQVNDFVDSHEKLTTLDQYSNAEKLKQELKEDTYNGIKKKKEEKREQNKKLFYKGLAGVAGFGIGLVASSVPGVGTIRMVAAGAKLLSKPIKKKIDNLAKIIKIHTNKHQEGKVAKILNPIELKVTELKEKVNNAKEKLNEKYPKIMEKVRKAKEFIRNHKEEINWFVNGFSAGYITGNLIELTTGKTFLELFDQPEVEGKAVGQIKGVTEATEDISKSTVEPMDYEPTPPELPEPVIPDINPVDITLNPGDVIDVSQLEYGLVSPDATNAVHLLNEVGKQVEVDKFVKIGEKTMVHLKQMNGLGYAWFDLADVQEVLANAAEVTKGMKM